MAYLRGMAGATQTLRSQGVLVNNRYKIIRVLGHGASGEVYVVEDTKVGQEIVLKYLKLPPELTSAIEHFKHEFEVMTHLNNPNIARVYNFGWDEELELYYFTSELIHGVDFVTASRRLGIEAAEELFIQALRALEYLHGNHIYHFDIKPQNLLVEQTESMSPLLKVIDFGLAGGNSPKKIIGTPSYIAPEIIKREDADGRADLYSLGVVMYYALTGINPFKGDTPDETINNHLTITPPPPAAINGQIPRYLNDIIMKLLEVEPKDRYQSPGEVIHDINFKSQRFRPAETTETLLSYIPSQGQFIGREQELAHFSRWLKDLMAKPEEERFTLPMLWVIGGLGSGKSRILDEFRKIAELKLFGITEINTLEELASTDVEKELAGEGQIIVIDDFDKKARTYTTDVVCKFIESYFKIACEITNLGKSTAIIISSNDNSETISNIDKCFDLLPKESSIDLEKIHISHFTQEEVARYLSVVTGSENTPPSFISRLLDYTGGNPLFLTEVFRQMILSGMLFGKAGRWRKITLEDINVDLSLLEIPSEVTSRLHREYQHLEEDEEKLVAILSAAKTPIPRALLAKYGVKGDLDVYTKKIRWLIASDDSIQILPLIVRKFFYQKTGEELKRKAHDLLAAYYQSTGENAAFRYHTSRGSDFEAARKELVDLISKLPPLQTIEHIEEYIQRFGVSDDTALKLLLRKAEVYKMRGRVEVARKIYTSITAICDSNPHLASVETNILAHIGVGLTYLIEKRFEDAISCFRKAKEIAQISSNKPLILVAENYIAYIDIIIGNYDYAIQKYLASREAAKKLSKSERLKIHNNALGHAYKRKGDIKNAIKTLKEDEGLLREAGHTRELAKVMLSLGEIYSLQQKYSEAESYFDTALKTAQEAGSTDILYEVYHNIGNLLNLKKNYKESIGYFERALDLALYLENHEAAAGTMINIAIVYSNIGEHKRSEDMLKTALQFLSNTKLDFGIKDLYLLRIHLELGELYRISKDFEKARLHLAEARGLGKNGGKIYLFWIALTEAKCALDTNDLNSFRKYIAEAEALADTPDKKSLLKGIKDEAKARFTRLEAQSF